MTKPDENKMKITCTPEYQDRDTSLGMRGIEKTLTLLTEIEKWHCPNNV
jgi:hypothetical protein